MAWAPEPTVYFHFPYLTPFLSLLCSDFSTCPWLLLEKFVMTLQSQRKFKKQRSVPNAFSFSKHKLHVCVCVHIVCMCSTTLLSLVMKQRLNAQKQNHSHCTCPSLQRRRGRRCAWAPLPCGVLHCLWSEIVT